MIHDMMLWLSVGDRQHVITFRYGNDRPPRTYYLGNHHPLPSIPVMDESVPTDFRSACEGNGPAHNKEW